MRTRFFVLAGAVTSISAAGIIQACGGDSATESSPVDAGSDVATDTGKRDAPVVEEDAATCDRSADFTKGIPDAAMADGATTTGICVGCAKANCKKFIDDCNKNCQCQELAAKALDCYFKSGDAFKCGAQFGGANISKETQQTAFGMFSCLQAKCEDECATEEFDPDAGPKDAATDG